MLFASKWYYQNYMALLRCWEGITLQIEERERIGLVGVNGARPNRPLLKNYRLAKSSHDGGQIFRSKEVTTGLSGAKIAGLHPGNTIGERNALRYMLT